VAIDPRKRQKKLAKERAKRNAKALASRRAKQGRSSSLQRASLGLEFELAVSGPVYECYVNEKLMTSPDSNQGMGTVVVSRLASAEMIVAGVYLLDLFCLGVKNAFATILTREEFQVLYSQTRAQEPLMKVEPAVAKKLIEDTVAYARSLGFEPHPDFRPARKLLVDIDASACNMEFTFGCQGKPHFISGPSDSRARIQQIRDTLERTCGKDNYNITILLGDPFGDDDYEEEEVYIDDGDEE
jgi:hypothetical protein